MGDENENRVAFQAGTRFEALPLDRRPGSEGTVQVSKMLCFEYLFCLSKWRA